MRPLDVETLSVVYRRGSDAFDPGRNKTARPAFDFAYAFQVGVYWLPEYLEEGQNGNFGNVCQHCGTDCDQRKLQIRRDGHGATEADMALDISLFGGKASDGLTD